jgi:molybdopterin converting factor small subunit
VATVHIPALLRPLTGGTAELQAAGPTLREIIADVIRQQPALSDRIADANGILPEIMIAIGDTEALNVDTAVPEGADVWILPSLAGG